MKKILVTGSNGLVGSSLMEELGDGHIYHTRKDCDLNNFKETEEYIKRLVNDEKIDSVIHCAAKVGGVLANSKNNDLFFLENYQINNNLIQSLYKNKIKNFVNILSTCIFPNENVTYPLTANQINNGDPHHSNYGYSYAKRLSGYETSIFKKLTGYNWINVIPTNVYGINDNFNIEGGHIIPSLIHKAYLSKKNNDKFIIWGDGHPLRQFINSKDLAKNILWAMNNWKSDSPFMAVKTEEISIKEISLIISQIFSIDEKDLFFDEKMPSGQFKKPAVSDIPKEYNFIDIKDGLKDVIDWFIKNYENVRK